MLVTGLLLLFVCVSRTLQNVGCGYELQGSSTSSVEQWRHRDEECWCRYHGTEMKVFTDWTLCWKSLAMGSFSSQVLKHVPLFLTMSWGNRKYFLLPGVVWPLRDLLNNRPSRLRATIGQIFASMILETFARENIILGEELSLINGKVGK